MKTKFENLVCKISHEVFELGPSYLVFCIYKFAPYECEHPEH